MPTKKGRSSEDDDLRPEYELSELKNPVRGKYYRRAMASAHHVLLDPDVAMAFPDWVAVNDALRMLIRVARAKVRSKRSSGNQPDVLFEGGSSVERHGRSIARCVVDLLAPFRAFEERSMVVGSLTLEK